MIFFEKDNNFFEKHYRTYRICLLSITFSFCIVFSVLYFIFVFHFCILIFVFLFIALSPRILYYFVSFLIQVLKAGKSVSRYLIYSIFKLSFVLIFKSSMYLLL